VVVAIRVTPPLVDGAEHLVEICRRVIGLAGTKCCRFLDRFLQMNCACFAEDGRCAWTAKRQQSSENFVINQVGSMQPRVDRYR